MPPKQMSGISYHYLVKNATYKVMYAGRDVTRSTCPPMLLTSTLELPGGPRYAYSRTVVFKGFRRLFFQKYAKFECIGGTSGTLLVSNFDIGFYGRSTGLTFTRLWH